MRVYRMVRDDEPNNDDIELRTIIFVVDISMKCHEGNRDRKRSWEKGAP